MTTMSDTGTARAGSTDGPARTLRRSTTDRVISGVAGGLGQYFGVEPVIFRVLFAVLSFFGGVGLLAYGVAWMLVPEPDTDVSMLDKALHELRVRKVPPWLVVVGGAVVVWISWFSWWAPGTLPAILLLAVVVLVLMHRLVNRPKPMPATPPWAGGAPSTPPWAAPATVAPPASPVTEPVPAERLWPEGHTPDETDDRRPAELPLSLTKHTPPEAPGDEPKPEWPVVDSSSWPAGYRPNGEFTPPPVTDAPSDTRLIPPLADTRRNMQAWLSEATEAHRARVQRRRPVKLAIGLALVLGWGIVALFDTFNRAPFPAYLWTGLAILGVGLLVSLAIRRAMLSLLMPLLLLAVVAVGLGGTPASLSDGSGDIGWKPATNAELTTYRQFAGRSTLDLTGLTLSAAADVRITQAAGVVKLEIPKSMNATVIADVHFGDIQNGRSNATGDYQSGMNVRLQLNPASTATGPRLTIRVTVTDGHIQVDRV